jgi:hypothetical protein
MCLVTREVARTQREDVDVKKSGVGRRESVIKTTEVLLETNSRKRSTVVY